MLIDHSGFQIFTRNDCHADPRVNGRPGKTIRKAGSVGCADRSQRLLWVIRVGHDWGRQSAHFRSTPQSGRKFKALARVFLVKGNPVPAGPVSHRVSLAHIWGPGRQPVRRNQRPCGPSPLPGCLRTPGAGTGGASNWADIHQCRTRARHGLRGLVLPGGQAVFDPVGDLFTGGR
jgi:hypothetical protein